MNNTSHSHQNLSHITAKPDKGLLNLINQKLELGISPKEIEHMLTRAGFEEREISHVIEYAVKEDKYAKQREVAENDFLPPLKKIEKTLEKNLSGLDVQMTQAVSSALRHRGLFNGRLRRKDFILGMLFFFGLGFVFFSIMLTWIQYLAPVFWQDLQLVVAHDSFGAWLIFIPFIFGPITLAMLSLITRRLHNLAMPGWMAWCFLLAFASPFGDFGSLPLLGMHIILFTLFIILISKKGHPAPNKHGALPPSNGSIFERIFSYERN